MTQLRTLTKNLIGEQDLLLKTVGGPPAVVQQRASGPLTISTISTVTVVNSYDELRNVTPEAFDIAILIQPDAAFSFAYYWTPANVEDDDGYNIIKGIGASAGNWVIDLNFSIETGMVAQPAGTQLDSPVITKGFTVVDTAVSALDAIVLPEKGIRGVSYKLSNLSANSINIFPNVGDSIDTQATNIPVVLVAGGSTMFATLLTGSTVQWYRF